MSKLVILTLHKGNFEEQGFNASIQISEEGAPHPQFVETGHLPPEPKIPQLLSQWQNAFQERLGLRIKAKGKKKIFSTQSAENLEKQLNQWLNSGGDWQTIRDGIINHLDDDDNRVIIQTEEPKLQQLPWSAWSVLANKSAEVALGASGESREVTQKTGNKVRILAVFGNSENIDIKFDHDVLEKLEADGAEIVPLEQPGKKELFDQLWDKQGWQIFFFAGHSESDDKGQIAWFDINQNESLSIDEFKEAFDTAIKQGLHLAIFNSCDGLGLANQLAKWHLPQSIVMREPVPDEVAHEFLQNFLTAFAGGQSLYASVREARLRLGHLKGKYPGVIWLPVICQNPTVDAWSWKNFTHTADNNTTKNDEITEEPSIDVTQLKKDFYRLAKSELLDLFGDTEPSVFLYVSQKWGDDLQKELEYEVSKIVRDRKNRELIETEQREKTIASMYLKEKRHILKNFNQILSLAQSHGGDVKDSLIAQKIKQFLSELSIKNLEWLHVHVQPWPLHVNNPPFEQYKDTLKIFISNAGNKIITIKKAYFGNVNTTLPVYPNAFRSASPGSFELKFGRQWREHSIEIKPGQRVDTYLPLLKPAKQELISSRKCGKVYLEYETEQETGIHVVQV
jgi:hypothetical protein